MRLKFGIIAAELASSLIFMIKRCSIPKSHPLNGKKRPQIWLIKTSRGDAFTAKYVGMGTGPLHVAKLPGIPGIETFKGHAFHTSRWDYAYTGGSPESPGYG